MRGGAERPFGAAEELELEIFEGDLRGVRERRCDPQRVFVQFALARELYEHA